MIFTIVRNGFRSLRRDRGALILSFVLPIAFFSIFAIVFGSMFGDSTPRVNVLVVDEDHSPSSERLVRALRQERALVAVTRPDARSGEPAPPDYTAATAEAAVKHGTAPVALVIPAGFGANPISFMPGTSRKTIRILHDSSNPVAAQVVAGMLQKVAMTSLSGSMADLGMRYFAQASGGLTPQQRQNVESSLARMHDQNARRDAQADDAPAANGDSFGGLVAVEMRDVVGENKNNPMVSFYAAAIGVMFLLFTASGAGGSLLDEAESGTLDRVLSSRVTMGTLLGGKLCYCVLLAFSQLLLMFTWAWLVFKVDFMSHIPGFVVMGLSTAFAVAAFGMLLASICSTRAQLGPLSTLVILIMSSIGGSMFPRFLMPEAMQKAGLLTINAWAIDGFTKVFWRDEPISHLWPQVLVLLGAGVVFFAIARRLARRWEYS